MLSESRGGPIPFLYAYIYDGNGNRLTHKANGTVIETYTYDAHDKLMTGVNGVNTWDPNGNMLSTSMNGLAYSCTWDDEDRLLSQTLGGHTDTYTYNGLGMRLTKTDPTGTHSYIADGVSPASPVLSDGQTAFTPGISETMGNGSGGFDSRFYLADAQGNSRGLLNAGQSATDGDHWDGFGNLMSRFGSDPTAYAWGEESGYQTDNDSGCGCWGTATTRATPAGSSRRTRRGTAATGTPTAATTRWMGRTRQAYFLSQ